MVPTLRNNVTGIPGQGIPLRQQARSATPSYYRTRGTAWANDFTNAITGNTRMGKLPHLYKHGPRMNNFTAQPRMFHSETKPDTSSSEETESSDDEESSDSDS